MFEVITNFIGNIFNIYYSTLDAIFMPIILKTHMAVAIFIISFIVSFIITLANKLLVDQDRMHEIKQTVMEYNKKLQKARNDPDMLKRLEEEGQAVMEMQMEMMRMGLKPMIYTWVPIILIFAYLRHVYGYMGIIHKLNPDWNGVVVYLPTILSKILFVWFFHWLGSLFYHGGFHIVSDEALGWLGWYILCSMATSMALRRIMGIK